MKRAVIMAVCVGVLPLGSTSAFAQELPSEAKFSITYTAVNPAPSKSVSVGDRDVVVSSSIMTALNDGGSGLLHNMAGRCNFMSEINKVAKTVETRGFCNYADRAGDQVFEEFMTNGPAPLGGPIVFHRDQHRTGVRTIESAYGTSHFSHVGIITIGDGCTGGCWLRYF